MALSVFDDRSHEPQQGELTEGRGVTLEIHTEEDVLNATRLAVIKMAN